MLQNKALPKTGAVFETLPLLLAKAVFTNSLALNISIFRKSWYKIFIGHIYTQKVVRFLSAKLNPGYSLYQKSYWMPTFYLFFYISSFYLSLFSFSSLIWLTYRYLLGDFCEVFLDYLTFNFYNPMLNKLKRGSYASNQYQQLNWRVICI